MASLCSRWIMSHPHRCGYFYRLYRKRPGKAHGLPGRLFYAAVAS